MTNEIYMVNECSSVRQSLRIRIRIFCNTTRNAKRKLGLRLIDPEGLCNLQSLTT
ncbi:hypothetical protein AGABI2DRAFT_138584 [Agaricus bisporus var. bisporus H97]|uniref:hypothetical protein n=1 Tax=Agaricus bisporus var. bisporus (strain H97 / ATCC MYA-4626 / FGSC 10389) TaxID=936046 RepID=UPI00029F7882|nr:hypothetical protein AGABI2DRAFT_138584 [Agaricus bisporus var. bisporus H97]EKV44184.1 hypothetical protein AGABI2DRAFT_138584 [Agaricus bisporus var. bisporus H97]